MNKTFQNIQKFFCAIYFNIVLIYIRARGTVMQKLTLSINMTVMFGFV